MDIEGGRGMKLVCKGKYNGDPATLPARAHPEGAVQFRELDSMKKLAVVLNASALALAAALLALAALRAVKAGAWENMDPERLGGAVLLGCLLATAALLPHELLHALCFRGEVALYTNLKQGMLFVAGTEDMSRGRFVFMSLLPNLAFGFLPFLLFLLEPSWTVLGVMGAVSIGSGCGDYMNVWNCLTQAPRGARVYGSGFHSYWYLP